jgi:benzoylformate decarboxylase
MQHLLQQYLAGALSRRGFFEKLVATGFSVAGARAVVAASQEGAISAAKRTVATGTGGDLVAEQIKAAGTKYIFTNPGSYEVGFFDALTDRPELQVIMGLHEGIVIPMADGYHKVTNEPAFVNVHAIGGTAQMAGQLSNSYRDGSAIVVTAGMKDISGFLDDAMLMPRPGFSQIEITRQFQKMAWEARDPASFPLMTRRAYRVAMAAPGGPVYVCYASAGLERTNVSAEILPRDAFLVDARPRPSKSQVERLARMLIESERPAIVVGDEVWKSGAQADVVKLAELVGLAVAGGSGNSITAFKSFPTAHRQYASNFRTAYPGNGPDVVVQYGTRDLGDYSIGSGRNAAPDQPLLGGARFAAVGIDPDTMGRTMPLDLAVVGHVAETTRDLIDAVQSLATADRLQKIRAARLATIAAAIEKARDTRQKTARADLEGTAIHPERVSLALDRVADRNAIIVGENWSGREASGTFINYGFRDDERMWLENGGRALGWGVGAALGAKLAAPNRQVILTIGDGAVMYSAAGLWSLARYGVPVLVVVSNNKYYQTVRGAFAGYNGRMTSTGKYHGLYLGDPDIDFVKLAESQGVKAERVTASADLEAALKRGVQATRDGKPYLLDVHVSRTGRGADSNWHQTFNLAATRTAKV